MADPVAVTNTFANGPGNTADATQVNQNFADLVGYLNNRIGNLDSAMVPVANATGQIVGRVISGDIAIDNAGNAAVNSLQPGAVATDTDAAAALGLGSTGRDYAEVLTEQTTISASFTDLTTAGPSVTVDVPSGGLVAVLVEVELKAGSAPEQAEVGIFETTDIPTAEQILSQTGTSYAVRRTFPGSPNGTTVRALMGRLEFPASSGSRTYTVKYRSSQAGITASFKNRKLWVVTLGGF